MNQSCPPVRIPAPSLRYRLERAARPFLLGLVLGLVVGLLLA